jgi:hypothetical protein
MRIYLWVATIESHQVLYSETDPEGSSETSVVVFCVS